MDVRTRQPVQVLKDLMLPMRDGVKLATDVYLPAPGDTRRVPLILERTPYDKCGISRSEITRERSKPLTRPQLAAAFAAEGFGVVFQDCRGRYRSEGEFTKYVNEAEDGFDTLAWLAAQPWSDGRVGTMGLSYGAHTQLALACLAPPGLACMFMDSGGFANAYQGGIRRGGAFELKQATWAFRQALQGETNAEKRRALASVDLTEWFRQMPWRPGHSPFRDCPEYERYLFDQWRNGTFGDFWKQPSLCAERFYDRIPDIPIAIVGSWYDPHAISCVRNFSGLARRGRSKALLLMGPWTHGDRSRSFAGDVGFGDRATLDGNLADDYFSLRLDWFRRCLGSGNAGIEAARPELRYFQMGGGHGARDGSGRLEHGGQWRVASSWPPEKVRDAHLHLHPGGALLEQPYTGVAGSASYRSDPDDPVPTIGGAVTSGEPLMRGGAFDQRVTRDVFTYRRGHPKIPLAQRPDVLVWETPVLSHDLIVTGECEAELWVSSDCPDTDFTVKLIDLYPPSAEWPDGYAMNLADGIMRARYRSGWESEVPMRENEVYRLTVKLMPTSNLFRAGHKLRIDIASSNYPHFDINPNTGGSAGDGLQSRVATNRVHFGAAHASRISLVVMEK